MKQETKDKIQELKGQGKTVREIHKELNLPESTVQYHYDDKRRKNRIKGVIEYFRNLPQERKSEIYKRRKEYITKYVRKKYRTNEAYRIKTIERVKKWKSKKGLK